MQLMLTHKGYKLAALADKENIADYRELFVMARSAAEVPGICMNKRCDHVMRVPRAERAGLCASCDDNSVCSILVLADIVCEAPPNGGASFLIGFSSRAMNAWPKPLPRRNAVGVGERYFTGTIGQLLLTGCSQTA
jgi:hypothetical protein